MNKCIRQNTVIGLCAHDGRVDMETVKGLLSATELASGLLEVCGTSHVSLARNQLVHKFLGTGFEWLVMIDTDIGFTGADFGILCSEDREIVICPYPKKTLEFLDAQSKGISETESVNYGMGFCRVHRSVFHKILEVVPSPCWINQHLVNDFFPNGPIGQDPETKKTHYVGEDIGFWSLCDVSGFKPYLENRTNLTHVGRLIFGS